MKGVEEFEEEREKLIHEHEEKKVELKRKHLKEEVELEMEFDTALTKLMEKYTPSSFETSSSSWLAESWSSIEYTEDANIQSIWNIYMLGE